MLSVKMEPNNSTKIRDLTAYKIVTINSFYFSLARERCEIEIPSRVSAIYISVTNTSN